MLEEHQRAPGVSARDIKGKRIIDWLSWKVLLPLVLIVGFWPLYSVLGMADPFPKACAPGELLIFSALILIEVAIEGESLGEASLWLHSIRRLAILLGIILVIPLAVFKLQAAQLEGAGQPGAAEKLWAYSTFGCAVAAASIVFSFVTFCITVNREHKLELQSFAQEEHPGS